MPELIFIRHGQTAGNLRHNYVGRTDEPLCPEGIANLQQKKAAGCYPATDWLICSPMQRCKQTAALIYPQLRPDLLEDLRECDFGDFENQNYQDLCGNAAYQQWLDSNGLMPFPGGESREIFAARCCRCFEQVVEQILVDPKFLQRVVFVVHGGTIMALLAAYAGLDYFAAMCENGGGYSCVLKKNVWRQQKRLLQLQVLGGNV